MLTAHAAVSRDGRSFSPALSPQNVAPALPHGSFLTADSVWFQSLTAALYVIFQISLERGLCFNHGIERFLHLGRQIICIDVLPLQFFPCHCLAPAWSDEKGIRYSS